jgi:glutathione S-transferase
MKLYTSTRAPNPRRVDIFLAEKGIEVPKVEINLNNLEQKQPEFIERNPAMRVPVLELDDGTCISESIAICRYFEEIQPDPPLFGVDTLDRALVEMWQRRIELNLMLPVAMVFRHLHPGAAVLEQPQVAEWGEANRPRVIEAIEMLDRQLADRPFVTGDRFTVADISALVGIDFMRPSKFGVPENCANVLRWHSEVSARPSAKA